MQTLEDALWLTAFLIFVFVAGLAVYGYWQNHKTNKDIK